MNARSHRPVVPPALGFSFAIFALVLGAVFALFAGCGLNSSGLASLDGGTDAGACTTPAQCDDGNPCTADTCTPAGECASTPVAEGPAPTGQTPGDCLQVVRAARV